MYFISNLLDLHAPDGRVHMDVGADFRFSTLVLDAGMSELRLRAASAHDVPAITALVKGAYGHYVARIGGPPRPLEDDYEKVVRDGDVTVAEAGGRVVGLIVLGTDEEGFFVDNVAVARERQGTGVGRELLLFAEERAREGGYGSIWLLTHELMHENLALYERIGYAEYKRHDYGGGSLVYLRKSLSGES
jgi:GNAT superfamily N-acetyltransferase